MKKIFFICGLIMIGCSKQKNFSPVYSVPVEFQPYVTGFVHEAAVRGHSYTIDNLIIKYDSTLTGAYCANSNIISAENNVQKIITVNPNIKCWQNDLQLETLIFHELGHCFLGRDHDNTLMPKGDPKSIMVKSNITIYSPCVYALGDSCNKQYRRTYYLDELFNPSTPVPDWAK